jgi:predicted acetyltransferase
MRLIKPTLKYGASWKGMIEEFEKEKYRAFWNWNGKPTDLKAYIKKTRRQSRGGNFWDAEVPATTYWLMDKDALVGHVNIRHALSERLKKIGGHIGYAIRPSQRRKGYGMKILELALVRAKKIGLKKPLVTCDERNMASRKIIERNGGQYQDTNEVENHMVRRYWISLLLPQRLNRMQPRGL